MGARDLILGDTDEYNYGALCMPNVPYCGKKKSPTRFYGKDEPIPLLLSLLMGLQHAFAMVGGLITPAFVVFKFTINFIDVARQQYAISAALITSGICTLISVSKFPIPFTEGIFGKKLYLGSGVLSVFGTSFTFLPIFEISIRNMKADGVDPYDAYGKMLGTAMVCGLLELLFSITAIKSLKKIFPPVVTSVTVILIGVALTGTGMKYWGGGVVCAEMIWKEHSQLDGLGVSMIPGPTCTGNGNVQLGYGSAEYIGLGFSVMVFLVVIELFGSIFMKNCNVILALLFGYMVAGIAQHDGNDYVDSSKIEAADSITFLWTETFPIGFYAPAVVPLLIAYIVTTVETVGDITAVYEVSNLETDSQEYDESIQGGLTADAICSILAGLFTSMPNTTFSQNNGVIGLTKCASRRAGYACGFWLIFMGVFGKIAGIITSIPDCVVGGMTIFLFCNVLVSGIVVASTLDLHSRRIKFIMALSLCVGVGVTVWPFAFQDMRASSYTANFWRCEDCSDEMQGFRNGISIFLSTGYCVGSVIAIILNLILPADEEVLYSETEQKDSSKSSESEADETGKEIPKEEEEYEA